MITQAVGALFNACWQGLAIVAVTSLALRLFPRSSAATRYAIWFAALIAIAALPAIDFGLARVSLTQPVVTRMPPSHFTIVNTGTVSYPQTNARTSGHAAAVNPPTTTIGYAIELPPDPARQLQALATGVAGRVGAVLSSVAMPIVLMWLFFGTVMLYRLGLAYVRLRRVKHGLVPMKNATVNRLIANSGRPVVVGIAEDLAMPCVLGFAKPAIALPARLAAELTHDDLERIVRHEHAHVRRWDDVANAVQLIVQAVMCLNPAVHLIGRSLNIEREIACDDFAVEPLAERLQYAKCLTHIAVSGFGRGSALPAPGFFLNRKQLIVRVERLLERGHNGSTTIAAAARYALAGLALVAIAVARVQLPVVAATTVVPTFMVGHAPVVPTTSVVPTFKVGRAPVVPTFMVGHAPVVPTFKVGHAHVVPTFMVDHAFAAFRAMRVSHVLSLAPMVSNAMSAVRMADHISRPLARRIAVAVSAVAPIVVANSAGSSGPDFLDALAAAGYKNLSVDDLVRLKNVGVDGGLIDAAVRYSGSRPSVEMLVRMASVGVDSDFLNNLQSSSYPRMPLEDVVRMRAIGVDPSYIRDMTAVLHTKPSIDQLTQLRALGVDPDYVRSLVQVGYDKLSPNDLMRLRAVGVDADYVRLLRSKGIGGSGLSVDDLIRMKSVGVE